ncbi:MAG TPA: hypothetical protein VFP60_14840 [Pseudolabrys sp.]|nr:hypothetical protein [Pseudolabrys sp.]
MSMQSKFTAAAVAGLTLAGAVITTVGSAHAHPRFGFGLGVGIAAGALIGAAAASNAYSGPIYFTPGYRECRLVERYDRWGNVRLIRVCDVY